MCISDPADTTSAYARRRLPADPRGRAPRRRGLPAGAPGATRVSQLFAIGWWVTAAVNSGCSAIASVRSIAPGRFGRDAGAS